MRRIAIILPALVACALPATANASGWSLQHPANALQPGGNLPSVSCASDTSCVAVGDYVNPDNLEATLVERWDGTSWTMVPSANPDASFAKLDAVSCPAVNACVAVGEADEGHGGE